MIRPLDLLDLPTLHRYRTEGITLDSVLAVTWGTALISARALMDSLFPAGGALTCLALPETDAGEPLLAQARHLTDRPACQVTFLAPARQGDSTLAAEALDYLARQAGTRGALHLLAEVEEQAPLFEALRRNQFTVIARQHLWRLPETPPGDGKPLPWRPCRPEDLAPVRRLYKALVPPLVQTVEPPPATLDGLVCWQDGKLRAYVRLEYGPRGIWLQPLLHPDLRHPVEALRGLWHSLPNRLGRPLYVNVRAYQGWLNDALTALGAQIGNGQAVMVRRLAVTVATRRRLALHILKNGQAEATTPIAHLRLPSEN